MRSAVEDATIFSDYDSDGDGVHHLRAHISAEDRELIRAARDTLEHPSFAARLSSIMGTPLEIGFKLLPIHWYRRLDAIAEDGIRRALNVAVSTIRRDSIEPRQERFHSVVGALSGAFGGLFGLPGLAIELPISTAIILRSIADIARSEGEELSNLETRLACMQVFALGGRTEQDDAAETGYYGVRVTLALASSTIRQRILGLGVEQGTSTPAMAVFIRAVAARFGVPVSQKAAAQLVPVVGAASGALLNTIFLHHFQSMARGHFTMRRLERKYGPAIVRAEYELEEGGDSGGFSGL